MKHPDLLDSIIALKLTTRLTWAEIYHMHGKPHWPNQNAMTVELYRHGYRNPVEPRGQHERTPRAPKIVTDADLKAYAEHEWQRRQPDHLPREVWIERYANGTID